MSKTHPFLWRFFSPVIRKKLVNQGGLELILTNMSWLLFDRSARMVVGLFVGVWLARYLGANQFGLLSFALSIVSILGVVATLGIQELSVRLLVKEPEKTKRTMSTLLIMMMSSCIVVFLFMNIFSKILFSGDPEKKVILSAISYVILFKFSDAIKYWFEAQLKNRNVFFVEFSVFTIITIIKVSFIILKFPLIYFVYLLVAEAVLIFTLFFFSYIWINKQRIHLAFDLTAFSIFMKSAFPMTLSGLAIIVFMRTDQIMLMTMAGGEIVGHYAAAIRISEIWYFVPTIVMTVLFPHLIRQKESNSGLFLEKMQILYTIFSIASVFLAIFVTIFAKNIVGLLYGSGFLAAAPILTIHIWSGVLLSLGTARGKWLFVENLQNHYIRHVVCGMIVNLIGNYLLIPVYFGVGAAISTLIAQLVVVFVVPYMFKETRMSVVMQLKALNPLTWADSLKKAIIMIK